MSDETPLTSDERAEVLRRCEAAIHNVAGTHLANMPINLLLRDLRATIATLERRLAELPEELTRALRQAHFDWKLAPFDDRLHAVLAAAVLAAVGRDADAGTFAARSATCNYVTPVPDQSNS